MTEEAAENVPRRGYNCYIQSEATPVDFYMTYSKLSFHGTSVSFGCIDTHEGGTK